MLAAIADPAVRVLSVDVFDTVVWRTVDEPVSAFPLVGERLRERGMLARHISPTTFFHVRARAEWQARLAQKAVDGSQEVDLEQVYAKVPLHVRGGFTDVAAMADVEVEVEHGLLLPDLDVVALLRAALAAGKRVVAVSDTYFTRAHLQRLLDLPELADVAFERVFVSSEHGVGKGHGLFDLVLRELDVDASEVVHLGDNREADVDTPRELGIRTVWFERRAQEVQEVLAREAAYGGAGLGRTDAGLSALRSKAVHRTAAEQLPAELRDHWRYGATVLGPVLTGFAEWVQRRAREAGVDTVHCLMREGAVLADLVEGAASCVPHPVQAEKAWLSRQVCARASVRHGSREELTSLLDRRQKPTVREFCTTVGVRADDLPPRLRARADARLSDPVLQDELVTALVDDPDRRAEVVASSRALRDRIVRYARTLVPGGSGLLVLVDLGWAGTIQTLLQRILREEGVPIETLGLYLVTHEGALDRVMQGIDLDAFLVVNGDPGGPSRAVIRSPEILEQVCMPDFGSQVDLDADLRPVLAPQGVDADLVQSVERDAVQKGYAAFQREWARYSAFVPGRLPSLAEHTGLLRAVLARSVAAPTPHEVRLFDTWVHDENFGSEGADRIVGGTVERAVRHLDPAGLVALPMGDVYWPFALAARKDEHLARGAEEVALGRLSPDVVSSVLETGPFEVFVDTGYGFSESAKAAVEVRRNRFGLSYASATLRGPQLTAVRIDPVNTPAVVRIDWVSLRLWVEGAAAPVEVLLDTPEALGRLQLKGCSWLRPKILVVDTSDPHLSIELGSLVAGRVFEVTASCAFAVLPTAPPPPTALAAGKAAVKQRLRGPARVVRAVEHRTGLPLEAKLRGVARRLR